MLQKIMFQFIANFLTKKKPLSIPRFNAPCALDLKEPGRVLVFAPHPDDDILGCGGTLLKLAQTANICVVLVTDGSGAGELPDGTDKVRQGEFVRALELLGVTQVKFLNQPDGFFQSNESWIFLPARFDYHRDHILISEFVSDTATAVSKRSTLIEYETSAPIQATHLVDITDVWNIKVKALKQHGTALAYGDYLRAITGLNTYRGLYLGVDKFAEAFRVCPSRSDSISLCIKAYFWRFRNWYQKQH
jgi:LmbE family N-acetylglucosaminyl deacetylase